MSIKQEPTLTILVNEGISNENYNAVNLLINSGANPRMEYRMYNSNGPLRWLMIKLMLEEGVKPAEINTSQSPGIEYIAVSYTSVELEYCIQKGLNPKAYPHIIHAALESQSLKDSHSIDAQETQDLINKIKLLLDHGADMNGNDHFLFKPIVTAMIFHLNIHPVLQFMLENGADVNAKTVNKINSGYENELPERITPLMIAAYFNKEEYVELLLRYNANKNIKDSSGLTAFHYALKGKANEAIQKKLK
jgi:hypothetical protein